MSDFSVRSDNVDVEHIMGQIRTRIREKRGVDYTEEEIRELANVKLEKFIDPKGVRSGLLEEYRRVSQPGAAAPNYAFGEETLYETHRGPIRWIRSLLRPILKLLFNPNPLIQALHIQADLNRDNAERWAKRQHLDALHYEVIHNLVVEVTRSTLEVKSLKMRLESMASRLDFDERRARALEGVVQYRPGSVAPLQPPTGQDRGSRGAGSGSRPNADRRDRDQRPQGQRPPQPPQPQPPPQSPQPPQQVQATPTAGDQPPANALDNDGNERRARRRRRRGRRRGGEGRPPLGEASGPGEGESGGGSDETGVSAEPDAASAAPVEHRTPESEHRAEAPDRSHTSEHAPPTDKEPPSE
ncbi:MAG TPA: hypothetical protein VGI12_03475 [Vicinamibacterales bacterium]|jgi:hypothetical protein